MQITNVNFALGGMNVQTWDPPVPLSIYAWSWGDNTYGSLGLGDTTNRSSPTQIGNSTDWSVFSSVEGASLGIKTDGTLWSWGYNANGALGLGNTTHRSSPVQVGSLTNWFKIAVNGDYSSYAIKTDGTLWAWGYNGYGQLGLGNTTDRSSPVQVGALTNWAFISGNGQTAKGIKTDGTMWSWGYNTGYNLGLGDLTNRSSPVQVGSDNTWAMVTTSDGSDTLAIKNNGTLWAIGGPNNYGNLGLGTTNTTSVVTQVGALTNWATVACGPRMAVATKTDGTLWSWGRNSWGALGLGNTTYYSSPKQVGALTDWESVAPGQELVLAIKTDGTLWAWGNNGSGTLGDGTTISRNSPVQIGSNTTWTKVYSSGYSSIAIG